MTDTWVTWLPGTSSDYIRVALEGCQLFDSSHNEYGGKGFERDEWKNLSESKMKGTSDL